MTIEHFLLIALQIISLFICSIFHKAVFWYMFLAYNLSLAVVAVSNNYEGLMYPFIIAFTLISLVVSINKAFNGEIY